MSRNAGPNSQTRKKHKSEKGRRASLATSSASRFLRSAEQEAGRFDTDAALRTIQSRKLADPILGDVSGRIRTRLDGIRFRRVQAANFLPGLMGPFGRGDGDED